MAEHEIHSPKDFSETLRKLLTTDPAHADTFNPLFERLINNDAYLKAFIEGILAASTGHKHSGTDGDGAKIPLANIDVPNTKGSIVTADQLTAHINERNPHGTRASDVGAVSEQEFATHLADYVKHPGYGVATGSANAYAVTLNPAPTAYVDGMAVSVKIPVDSTGASTLNVNGLGAKPLKKANGNDVTNLKANGVYTFRYNASSGNFILQGEGGGGTAQPAEVLSGKTFTNDNGEQTGTMPNRGAMTITPTTTDQVIPAGYHNGSGKVKGDANLIPANIKNGVSIFGVTGTLSPLITYSNQNDNTQAPWLSNKYSNYSVRYKLLPDGGYYKVTLSGNNIIYETYNAAGTLLTSKTVVTLDAYHSLRDIYDDCFYVYDSMNFRIKKYDYNGNLLQMNPSNSSLYSDVQQVSKEGFCDGHSLSNYIIFDMSGNILLSLPITNVNNHALWISPKVAILYTNSANAFHIASIKNNGSVQVRAYTTSATSIQAALQTIFTQMEQFLRY